MAIAELLTLRLRKKIAWFSDVLPSDGAAAFNERGFAVELCTDEDLQDSKYLVGITAVVFTQNANKPTAISLHLEKYGQKLLDYDCRIILRPSSREIPPGSKQITTFTSIITDSINSLRLPTASLPVSEAKKLNVWQPIGAGNPPLPHAHFFDEGVQWSHVANFIVEHPAGKSPDFSLKIFVDSESKEGLTNTLSPCRELLIRRAFWDCKEVHLVPENDGQSGVMVYRAYADLAHGHIGPWPLPYFVKIGNRQKIFKEYDIYNKYVDPYVPFHLGPHLIHERCCLGSHEGVIVGDYVEESESLQNCARDGRAAQAIASLFNRTLHGWYRHTEEIYKPLTKCIRFPYFPINVPKLVSNVRAS